MGVTGEWPRWKLKEDDDEILPLWTGKTCVVDPTDPDPDCPDCKHSARYIAEFGHDKGCPQRPTPVPPPRLPTGDVTALPTDYNERKALPLYDFMFGYFPLAWLEVAKVAVAGNNQHNPGEKLHWAREKSTDQLNTAFRHLFDHGMGTPLDTDGCYHLAKVIWRLSAELQLIVEKSQAEGK